MRSSNQRTTAPGRSMVFPFVSGLIGAVCGTALMSLMGGGGSVHSYKEAPQNLALASDLATQALADVGAGSNAPVVPVKQCPEWDLVAAVQKQAQHDYCVRRFTGRPARPDMVKTQLHLPASTSQDFFVYKNGDIVSDSIKRSGAWEPHMAAGLVDVLARTAEAKGLPRERVHLLDIGGNVGSHTVYVQAAGFPVIAFEPMLNNEDIIRSNLCVADPEQRWVTFFTKGLGAEDGMCTFYSPSDNQGDGVLFCDGTKSDNPAWFNQGQVEVRRLDHIFLPCHGGTQLPPGMVFGAMKMDVEGFEPYVLDGGRRFLTAARIPFIVFEIGRLDEEKRRSVLRFFYDLGYQASAKGFGIELAQPKDLPGVEDVFLALPLTKEGSTDGQKHMTN